MSNQHSLPPSKHLDVSSFQTDPSYQRDPKDRLPELKRMAAKFDPQLFGTIHITYRRDGKGFIIDGAGRAYVHYVLLGRTALLPCIVLPPMSVAEEARQFVNLNRNRKAINSGGMFKADVAAEDEEACAIQRIFDELEMTIGRGESDPANIASVQSVKSIHRANHDFLRRSLAIKKTVWPNEVVGGGLLEGIAAFLRHVPRLDETAFRKVLLDNPPKETLARLKKLGGDRMPLKRYIPEWAACLWADKYNFGRRKGHVDIVGLRHAIATASSNKSA